MPWTTTLKNCAMSGKGFSPWKENLRRIRRPCISADWPACKVFPVSDALSPVRFCLNFFALNVSSEGKKLQHISDWHPSSGTAEKRPRQAVCVLQGIPDCAVFWQRRHGCRKAEILACRRITPECFSIPDLRKRQSPPSCGNWRSSSGGWPAKFEHTDRHSFRREGLLATQAAT